MQVSKKDLNKRVRGKSVVFIAWGTPWLAAVGGFRTRAFVALHFPKTHGGTFPGGAFSRLLSLRTRAFVALHFPKTHRGTFQGGHPQGYLIYAF